jgi:hypothetical protein
MYSDLEMLFAQKTRSKEKWFSSIQSLLLFKKKEINNQKQIFSSMTIICPTNYGYCPW